MQRKLLAAVVTLGAGFASSAFAQSNVTIYGIVDQSVRYTNNSDANNDSQWQVTNGAITNSRFGFKGEEDLGGGTKAVFKLENGFDPQTGKSNQNGALFGRYAFVGLSNAQWGTLTIGRQGTESFNFFGDFDPLTVGNYTGNSWPFFMTIGRISNTVTYAGSFNHLNVGATYGFGNQAGSLAEDSYWGVRASYDMGPLSFGGTYQQQRDINNNIQRMWGAAARYAIGDAKLFFGYMGGRDAMGYVDSALNDSTRTITQGSFTQNPRHDMTLFTGATYQATSKLALTGAFYYDNAGNINGIAGNGGKRYTGVLLAEYSLSVRTQVYGTVDYNKVTGGATVELPGNSSQTGVGVGIRHIF